MKYVVETPQRWPDAEVVEENMYYEINSHGDLTFYTTHPNAYDVLPVSSFAVGTWDKVRLVED